MKPFLSRLFGAGPAVPDTPVGPDQHYSVILRRRLGHWKHHAAIKTKAVRDEIERLRHYNEKVNAYAFMRSQGIPCPSSAEYANVFEAMAAHADNPRFVLKPAAGHSSNGVYLVTRNADGSLDCHMTQRKFASNDELARHYDKKQKLSAQFAMSEQVIVEEYVEDAQGHAVPLDYKVYAFHTGSALILQKHGPLYMDKRDRLFNFYDAKGTLLHNIREEPAGERRRSIHPPASFKELLDLSDKLVRKMEVSFIRLDFFLTTKGIYFGECTPLPNLGKKAFFDEYEEILGRHWTASLKAVGVDYLQP
jgi:hypothetical protein